MSGLEFITPKFVVAVIFLLIPLVYWVFNFVVLYHLLRFGVGVQPKRLAVIYFLGSTFLFFVCIIFFINIDISSFKDGLSSFVESNSFFYLPK